MAGRKIMQRISLILVGLILSIIGAAWLFSPDRVSQSTGQPLIGGTFAAVDHNGQAFSDKDLLGRYSLLYFGFTYCPDICPTGLLTLANALDSLSAPIKEKIQPVFVTVDPKRDTVDAMSGYVANFHPKIIGLTGTVEQMDVIAKAYKVYYQVVEQENSAAGYLVDHSGYFYLMGPDGSYVKHFSHNISEQALAAQLRAAIQ